MAEKIRDLSLALFFVVGAVGIVLGLLWLKPALEAQTVLIEETRANQEKVMKAAEETRAVLAELGYATVVLAMMENKMIQPDEGNAMIAKSVRQIEQHSERLGKLARIVNEFRIKQEAGR